MAASERSERYEWRGVWNQPKTSVARLIHCLLYIYPRSTWNDDRATSFYLFFIVLCLSLLTIMTRTCTCVPCLRLAAHRALGVSVSGGGAAPGHKDFEAPKTAEEVRQTFSMQARWSHVSIGLSKSSAVLILFFGVTGTSFDQTRAPASKNLHPGATSKK